MNQSKKEKILRRLGGQSGSFEVLRSGMQYRTANV
jgi:hypothetical protein